MRRAIVLFALLAFGACRDRETPAPVSSASPPAAASAPPVDPAPPPAPFSPERVTTDGKAMGTHLAFAAFTTDKLDKPMVEKLFADAIAEIQRVEALMTTWRPDSEVSRINAAAGKQPVAVGQETFDIVKESVHASEMSSGAFDITFESLHGLWKFDQDLDPHPPTDAQIKAKLPLLNFHHIKLDAAARTVFLDKDGVKIGLGGIAKGYAVDKAAEVLLKGGLNGFYVQAGGDLYTHGKKPDGSDWIAGVRDPRSAESDSFAMLPITDHAFSTAGDYERSYVIDGKRYHHIIDPRTGYPATASRSVTIWAPTALLADEIDDAVFILGPEKGLALVESIDGVGAVIVDAKNVVHISKRLEGKIRIVHPPHDGV
jgi:thiamine biosynthesis lipoprotein